MDELTAFQRQHLLGMRMIIERLDRLTEPKPTGRLRVFLSTMWKAFSEQLATNLGQWAAGLPLWLLALELLGFRELLAKLAGLSG
jgi:hypothetical protein